MIYSPSAHSASFFLPFLQLGAYVFLGQIGSARHGSSGHVEAHLGSHGVGKEAGALPAKATAATTAAKLVICRLVLSMVVVLLLLETGLCWVRVGAVRVVVGIWRGLWWGRRGLHHGHLDGALRDGMVDGRRDVLSVHCGGGGIGLYTEGGRLEIWRGEFRCNPGDEVVVVAVVEVVVEVVVVEVVVVGQW